MSGVTVTVTYTLAPRRSAIVRRVPEPKLRTAPRRPNDRTARMLALAHYVDRLIEDGVIADYAEAAEKLEISRARVTQILDLTTLAPEIQGVLLLGTLDVHERRLRSALRSTIWLEQHASIVGLPNPSERIAAEPSAALPDPQRC